MIDYIDPMVGLMFSAFLWLILFVMILLEIRSRKKLEKIVVQEVATVEYERKAQDIFDQMDYEEDK